MSQTHPLREDEASGKSTPSDCATLNLLLTVFYSFAGSVLGKTSTGALHTPSLRDNESRRKSIVSYCVLFATYSLI